MTPNLDRSLPAGWTWAPLGDLVRVIRGVTFKKGDARSTPKEGYFPILRANNIEDSLTFNDLVFVPERYVSEEQRLRAGDIVLAASSGSKRVVGKAASLHFSWQGSFGAFCFALRPLNLPTGKYLALFLQSAEYRNYVARQSTGININNVRAIDLETLPVPLPPEAVQARIVTEVDAQLTRLNSVTETLKRIQVNSKRYRATILKTACEGRLLIGASTAVDASIEATRDPATLPKGWSWAQLGQFLTRIEAGKSFKCEERPPLNEEVGVLKVSAVTWGHFDEHESKTCTRPDLIKPNLFVREGDFLFSRANTLQLVGTCVIVGKTHKTLMLSDKILRLSFERIPAKWLLYILRSPHGRAEIERLATGNQESMRNIGQDRIRMIRIPVPPLGEIGPIIGEIERRLSLADQIDRSIELSLGRLRTLRLSVLKAAFAGSRGRAVPASSAPRSASCPSELRLIDYV